MVSRRFSRVCLYVSQSHLQFSISFRFEFRDECFFLQINRPLFCPLAVYFFLHFFFYSSFIFRDSAFSIGYQTDVRFICVVKHVNSFEEPFFFRRGRTKTWNVTHLYPVWKCLFNAVQTSIYFHDDGRRERTTNNVEKEKYEQSYELPAAVPSFWIYLYSCGLVFNHFFILMTVIFSIAWTMQSYCH